MEYNQLKNKEVNNSTYSRKVSYLKDYFWIIQDLLDELIRNTEEYNIQSSKITGMPPSKIISTLDNIFIQKQNRHENIEFSIKQLFSKKREREEVINKLEDPQERYVLKCKYLLFKTFEEISLNLNKSDRQIKRWHASAINNLEISNLTSRCR